MMTLGFTGTKEGMNEFQEKYVRNFIRSLGQELQIAVHGDCMGADSDFHRILREIAPNVRIEIRPGISARDGMSLTRAHNEGDFVHPINAYRARNRDIVEQCDFLLGTPLESKKRKSGTWHALKYANRISRKGLIILREGSVVEIEEAFGGG